MGGPVGRELARSAAWRPLRDLHVCLSLKPPLRLVGYWRLVRAQGFRKVRPPTRCG
jgi:hypothetical protein